MKKKIFMVLALVIVFAVAFAACGNKAPAEVAPPADEPTTTAPVEEEEEFAATPEVTLLLTNHDPDTSLTGQYCNVWAEKIYQESKGRIEIKVNNGGSLAGPTESLDKVKAGTVDIAFGLPSFYPGQFTMTDGLSLPYLGFKSSVAASEAYMYIVENTEYLKNDTGYDGVKLILLRSGTDVPFITAKKKLNVAEDMKGMTIRSSTALTTEWLAAFGANGQGCPIGELYQNMQNGAFDGALTDWHATNSYLFYDNCAKYFADEQVNYMQYFLMMNEDKYNSLSDANKAVIDANSGQAALQIMLDAWEGMKSKATDSCAEFGAEVYKLPDAEHAKFVTAAEKVAQNWIAANGGDAQAVYDKMKELASK